MTSGFCFSTAVRMSSYGDTTSVSTPERSRRFLRRTAGSTSVSVMRTFMTFAFRCSFRVFPGFAAQTRPSTFPRWLRRSEQGPLDQLDRIGLQVASVYLREQTACARVVHDRQRCSHVVAHFSRRRRIHLQQPSPRGAVARV